MFRIEQTLVQFTQALLLGQSVVATATGEWMREGVVKKCLRQIFGRESARLVQVAQTFSTLLDKLESTPVGFSGHSEVAQERDFKAYIRAAEAILALLVTHLAPFAVSAYQDLQMRTTALKYRLEAFNGGLNPQAPRSDLQTQLQHHALVWKNSLEVASEKHLDVAQIQAIEEISRFPEFVQLLLKSDSERLAFFNWALRDKIAAALFVQYPALCRRLVHSHLNGRISRIGEGKLLKIVKAPQPSGVMQKIVTLPFEGREVNILDDNRRIEFRGGYSLSLAEIFDVFRDKHLRVGNLEFMEAGIVNWNVQKWAWWNAAANQFEVVDMTQKAWWRQLPFFEVIALQRAKERYGSQVDGFSWIAAATATRGRASLDVDLTHAYLEIGIPMDKFHYAIFDFGKLANEFPATFMDTLAMVCNTVHATIAYPDENVFYTHRQHAQHHFILAPIEGIKLMDAIKKDMISSRGLNFVYQVESENCAKWVHEKLEIAAGMHAIPNLFVMSIFHTEPLSFLRPIIRFCKMFPQSWQIRALTFFHLPLGAAKGHWVLEHGLLVWRALTHHPFWQTGTIYLPCFLHKQKELGHLSEDSKPLIRVCEGIDSVHGVSRGTKAEVFKLAGFECEGDSQFFKNLTTLGLRSYALFKQMCLSFFLQTGPVVLFPQSTIGVELA